MENKEKFDYDAAIAELEKIVSTLENPDTPIDDIGKYVRRANELAGGCKAWLRGVRDRALKLYD